MATMNIVGVPLSGSSGSGAFVGNTSPVLVAPILGAATATSLNFGVSTYSAVQVGTWSPGIIFAVNGNLVVTGITATTPYIISGNLCTVRGTIIFTPTYTTSSGNIIINGMPATAAANINSIGTLGVTTAAYTTSTATFCQINASSSSLLLNQYGSTTGIQSLTTSNFTSGVSYTIYINISYQI
jgi:hypothetical protein